MLSIGEFSKICQVSVKALRYYDKTGLLRPSSVDEWTGYRYYDESLIPRMLLLLRLKRYGFSLAEIAYFLSENEEGKKAEMLRAQKTALESEAERTAAVIGEIEKHLRSYERTGKIMGYQNEYSITLEKTEDMPVFSSRQNMSVEDFGKYYGKLFEKAAKEHIETDGRVLAIYYDREFDPDNSNIEVAVGVKNEKDATRVVRGGMCASTLHTGAYSSLSDGYGAVMKWISENGYEVCEPPYEIYLKTQYDGLPPEKWETRIFFPVSRK